MVLVHITRFIKKTHSLQFLCVQINSTVERLKTWSRCRGVAWNFFFVGWGWHMWYFGKAVNMFGKLVESIILISALQTCVLKYIYIAPNEYINLRRMVLPLRSGGFFFSEIFKGHPKSIKKNPRSPNKYVRYMK